jgi:magnesium-transporting ATPase (P-type)
MMLIVYPKKEAEDKLDKALHSDEIEEIKISYYEYLKSMRIRYIVFFILSTIIIVFFWYLVICYCAVFSKTQSGWIYGSILSFMLTIFIFETLFPLFIVMNRSLALTFEFKGLYQYNLLNLLFRFLVRNFKC